MKYIEDEKRKLFLLAKNLEARAASLGRKLPPLVISPEKNSKQMNRKNSKFLNFNLENNENGAEETVFESFLGDENIYYHNNLKKKTSFLNNNLNNIINTITFPNNDLSSDKMELAACIEEFKSYCPQKYVFIITKNIIV